MSEDKFLTADEAREYDPARILRKHIKTTEGLIVKAAKAGSHSIKVPYEILEDLFERDNGGGYDINKGRGKEFCTHFRKQGFGVRGYYEARQFVDAGVIIAWDEKDGTN